MTKTGGRASARIKVVKRDNTASLRPLVGTRVYNVWVDMLRRLVPHGRTHRLSILVASCLQYAAESASKKWGTREPPEGSAAALLLDAWQGGDPDAAEASIGELAERLFRDAGVGFKRRNHRGQQYSIAADAVSEFMRWENLPWE
jgi:hypothetical protein